jgi:transglutaminase-like putative cysteine protease
MQMLRIRTVDYLDPNATAGHVEYDAIPQTVAGLQALGTITLPWAVDQSELLLNKIELTRGEQNIDVLKDAPITVLRRETNLDKSEFNGVRTAVVTPKGLQVGDLLVVAATYVEKRAPLQKMEQIERWAVSEPVRRLEREFIVPAGADVQWTMSPDIPTPTITKTDKVTSYRFVADNMEPTVFPSFTPERFKHPMIQFTSYKNWAQVADVLRHRFDAARNIGEASPVAQEAEKIAQKTADPTARMIAALRLAQEKVRYIAIVFEDGAYTPTAAEDTWSQKYGDCKAKTALLLALLDRLKIKAEPLLVSTEYDDSFGIALPGLSLFDHVMVRASVDGKDYYLDPTDYGQRTAAELSRAAYQRGLPLREGATLEKLHQALLDAPSNETEIIWDATNGLDGEIPFTAKLTLRGVSAAKYRAQAIAAIDRAALEEELKKVVPRISNDDLKISKIEPEAADGTYRVTMSGNASMDWSPFEGKKQPVYEFDQTIASWNEDFQREDAKWINLPVSLTRFLWQRSTETILLPNGGKGFKLQGSDIDASVAGNLIKRHATLSGNLATVRSEFRMLVAEMTGPQAIAATKQLKDINDSPQYLIGPKGRKRD